VYWEYVERALYFVKQRGEMNLGEGSETNAVAKIYKKYGIVPFEAYKGINYGANFHSHKKMFDELEGYLHSVKEQNNWNEEEVSATVKSILNFYLGVPPASVSVGGKTMTPQEYCTNVLKLKLDDYVDFMSLMEQPFYTQAEYKVPDNWWKDKTYYNVPLEEFMTGVKNALKNGYTISLGGDVSEAGFNAEGQVALIPSFDIPAAYIDDNARQFRFSNKTTTDDHAMHVVGYTERDGVTWFLLKDSGAGSRNCGETCKSFGYYFMREDYIKLKMMTMTVNKNAVKDLLQKFNKT
jgi:bleomycin hydrolase